VENRLRIFSRCFFSHWATSITCQVVQINSEKKQSSVYSQLTRITDITHKQTDKRSQYWIVHYVTLAKTQKWKGIRILIRAIHWNTILFVGQYGYDTIIHMTKWSVAVTVCDHHGLPSVAVVVSAFGRNGLWYGRCGIGVWPHSGLWSFWIR